MAGAVETTPRSAPIVESLQAELWTLTETGLLSGAPSPRAHRLLALVRDGNVPGIVRRSSS